MYCDYYGSGRITQDYGLIFFDGRSGNTAYVGDAYNSVVLFIPTYGLNIHLIQMPVIMALSISVAPIVPYLSVFLICCR